MGKRLTPVLLLAAFGCVPAPVVVERREAIDKESVRVLLDGLSDDNSVRRRAALGLFGDLGSGAAPILRTLLTRRAAPAEPFVSDLIRSLRAEESALRRVALDQLLLRGRRVEADLWEAIFSSDSEEVVTLSVELLRRIGGHPMPSLVVDTLRSWSAIPSCTPVTEGAAAKIAPVREDDGAPRFRRMQDDYSSSEVLAEPLIVVFPEQAQSAAPENP